MEDYYKHRTHANVYQPTTLSTAQKEGATSTAENVKAALKSLETAKKEDCKTMIKILWGMGIKVCIGALASEPVIILPEEYQAAFDDLTEKQNDPS